MQVVPTLRAYDPAYAYESAAIVRDGLRRMYVDQEDRFYYVTVYSENYPMPAKQTVTDDEILRGMYLFRGWQVDEKAPRVQLLGSGPILNESLRAADLLADRYGIGADVWSVTSWTELRRDALAFDRSDVMGTATRAAPYFTERMAATNGPIVAATDYLKALPDGLARWSPRRLASLGTDGFGRSDGRAALRDFFEVDTRHIAYVAVRGWRSRSRPSPPRPTLAPARRRRRRPAAARTGTSTTASAARSRSGAAT